MRALVTGGCHGLGKCFSLELLKRGYEVIALYLTSEDSAQMMMKENDNIKCIKCDITCEDTVAKVVNNIPDLDLVINNAALACDNQYYDKSLDEFMSVLKVNLGGTFIVSKYTAKILNPHSIIINISSNNSLDNYSEYSMDYDASKAGVNLLTKDFAVALKDKNIKVVAVAPGWINTEAIREMNPQFLEEEMRKCNQSALIDENDLVKKILDECATYKSGSINEIKEL